ncbi:hypothetical protein C8R44DRAFT_950832 [Mycena epipterygia]|nr:hypothetical protein C8R44DRAFT_950832 [Mycena epipterygia]
MNRLQKAVEALQIKVPVTDTKTAFWNAYKNVADEYDKEFQQRYGTDLDTSLIFAGLFSAVSSAFIIQIQPGIQPTHTLPILLVAQSLLYISLFATLLAALLAVLGKQWLMYYLAAGERGTIEARGVERQRKFDGLRKWKFDATMQIFPLLLQFSLLLFSAALSVYLWTIDRSIAIIVISLTCFGFASYAFLLISAIVDRDSPYQTPLVPILLSQIRNLVKFSALMAQISKQIWSKCSATYAQTRGYIIPYFTPRSSVSTSANPTSNTDIALSTDVEKVLLRSAKDFDENFLRHPPRSRQFHGC